MHLTDEQINQVRELIESFSPDCEYVFAISNGDDLSCGIKANCTGCLLDALFGTAVNQGLAKHNQPISKEMMH